MVVRVMLAFMVQLLASLLALSPPPTPLLPQALINKVNDAVNNKSAGVRISYDES